MSGGHRWRRERPPWPWGVLGWALVLALVWGGAGDAAHAEPERVGPLTFGYVVGQTYAYDLDIHQEGSVLVSKDAQPAPVSTRLRGRLMMSAHALPASEGVRLELWLEDVSIEGLAGVKPTETSALSSGLLRQRGNWMITPRGETIDFMVSGSGGQRSQGQVFQLLDDGVLRVLPSFPERPIEPGATWTMTRKSERPIAATIDQHHRLEGVNGRIATISLKRGAELTGQVPAQPTPIDIRGTGRGDGQIEFDLNARLVERLSARTQVEIDGYQGEQRALRQDVTLHVTLTRKR